ncbi:hypothetical protein L218DRAFT_959554 [Marasmius fiardii PR-910]|nr:hypothetical protein L218DRAFT_959554 [Marasmius fiardii PR-910]
MEDRRRLYFAGKISAQCYALVEIFEGKGFSTWSKHLKSSPRRRLSLNGLLFLAHSCAVSVIVLRPPYPTTRAESQVPP